MPGQSPLRNTAWLSPIVLLVCALMLLPGGAILASPASAAHAGGLRAAVTGPSQTAPTAPSASSPVSLPTPFLSTPTLQSSAVPPLSERAPSWLKSAFASKGTGATSAALASYPNIDFGQSPTLSPTGFVSGAYQNPPAPMGLVDYGVGVSGAYAYNTTHILATVVLNAPPNVTNPSSEGTIDPTGSADGLVGSPYEFGLQLNTIETNVSLPGLTNGTLWTQNVLNINDSGIHFVDDVFNFSYLSGVVFPTTGPASILSGCGLTSANSILSNYGGVYQCVGKTIPITAASYPLTIQLYNNASVSAQGDDQMAFGYRITGAPGLLGTGVSDLLTFNNPAAPTPPASPVGFEVNGFQLTPPTGAGSWRYDAEIVFAGSIGGTNAVFRSLNGTLTLQYANATAGPWRNIPSAYDFGSDTAESAVGVVATWTPNHVVNIDQGPSYLYGLWNSLARVAVSSGSIHFQGTVDPTYGFVFVSNVNPGSPADTNLSYVPTTAAGAFNTYLPPAIPTGGGPYYSRMYAAGVTEQNGTTFSTSQTGYTFPVPTTTSVLRAPLYMWGSAQAASLAHNVTGRPFTSTAPYVFSGLTVYLPFAFTHVNDFYYPSFGIFQAEGLTTIPVYVNNVVQGNNFGIDNIYERDRATSACGEVGGWAFPPGCFYNFPQYGQQFNIFDSSHARVTNETLYGSSYYGTPGVNGGVVFFFFDTAAYASNVVALYGSYGVFNGISTNTRAQNLTALFGANALDDVGSTGTFGWNIASIFTGSFGVYALDSWSGTYTWLNTSDYAVGYYSGGYLSNPYYALSGSHGSHVSEVNATLYATGAYDTVSTHDTFTTTGTYEGAGAVEAVGSFGTTIAGVKAWEAWGADLFFDDYTNISSYTVAQGSPYDTVASIFEADGNTSVTGATVTVYQEGFEGYGNALTSFTNLVVSAGGIYGVFSEYDAGFTVTNMWVNNSLLGVELEFPTGDTFTNSNADASEAALYVISGSGNTVNGLTTTGTSFGGELASSAGGTITGVTATSDYVGFDVYYDTGVSVSTVSASKTGFTGDASGILVVADGTNSVSGVTATSSSIGVLLLDSSNDAVSGVTASGGSIGVLADPGSWITVSGVTVSSASIGVVMVGSTYSTVSAVTATDTSLYSPFTSELGGFPIAAVVTWETTATSVTNVTAMSYPAALYDYASDSPIVADVNATSGYLGLALNDTFGASLTGIGAYRDVIGVQFANGAYENTLTASSFVDDSSYGVSLIGYADDNTIYNNNFIGNNGATGSYSASHIQAYSGDYNYFDLCTNYECTTGIGNYWADWHTYGPNGYLAPYLVTGDSWDYFPTGPEETFTVNFVETGLPSGTTWSVALGGVVQTAATATISFTETIGTYAFSVGSLSGWTSAPSSGSVTVSGATYTVSVTFSAVLYAVTLSAGGLNAGTTWSATVNGVTQSTSGPSLVFYLPDGMYTYSFNAVSNYNLPSTGASGSLTVAGAPLSLATTYSPTSTPSLASTSSLNNDFTIALALAAIALVIALVALFLRRSKPEPTPPVAWTPPAGSTGEAGGSGGAPGWSEGPGSPPS
jgi:Thermopsin/Periplasmic copper-binding protein (NosD)